MPVKTVQIQVTALTDKANRDIAATAAYFEKLRAANPVELQVKLDKAQALAESRILAKEMSATVRDTIKLDTGGGFLGGLPGVGRLFRGGTGPGAGLPGPLGSIPGGIGQLPPAVAVPGAIAVLAAIPLLAQAAATVITFGLGSALVGLGVYAEKGRKGVVAQFAGLQADVTKTFNNLSPAFGDALVTVLSAARTFVPQFIRDFKPALDGLSLPLKSLGVELAGTLASPQIAAAIRALGVAFGGILRALTPAIPGIVTSIADGFTRLFQAVAKNPKAITEMFVGLGHLIGVLLDVLAWLTNVADYLEHHWKPALTGVAAVVIDHWRGLRTFFGDLRQWLYDDFLLKTEQFFVTAWDKIWNNTIGRIQRGIKDAENWFHTLPPGVQHALDGLGRVLEDIGKAALGMLLRGLEAGAGGVLGWIEHFAGGIVGIFKKVWGWFSPSSVMYAGGKALMQGLANGIRDHAHLAQKAAQGAAAAGLGAAGKVSGTVAQWITAALQLAGKPMAWLGGMEALVRAESGGNPLAYNPRTAGTSGEHAEGIAQTIPSTFMAYALPGHWNIWNPVDDLIASLRYIAANYGSPYNIPGLGTTAYQGYDAGGWLMPGATLAVNRSGRPERVTSGAAEDAMLARLDAIIGLLVQGNGIAAQAPAVMGAALGMGGRSAVYGALYP